MMVHARKLHIQQAEAGGLLPEQYETSYRRKGGGERIKIGKSRETTIIEAKFYLVFTLLICGSLLINRKDLVYSRSYLGKKCSFKLNVSQQQEV